MAVAFRRGDDALRAEVQRELDRLGPWIAEAEACYGFPEGGSAVDGLTGAQAGTTAATATSNKTGTGIGSMLAAAATTNAADARLASPILLAQAAPTTGVGANAGDASAGAGAALDGTTSVERGRSLFNTNCSHCHGPDAASPDPRIDLRRLTRRHHEDKDTVFGETVTKGRPDKGMPAWGGVLPADDIARIKAFVDSVQAK